MKIIEIQELQDQWHVLKNEPDNFVGGNKRQLLLEQLIILHRLNELGETQIEGQPITTALEEINVAIRISDGMPRQNA
jgi:hypothetical protein